MFYFLFEDGGTFSDEWLTAYRYATPEEIVEYEVEKSRKKEIKHQINEKQKELAELYKKLLRWNKI